MSRKNVFALGLAVFFGVFAIVASALDLPCGYTVAGFESAIDTQAQEVAAESLEKLRSGALPDPAQWEDAGQVAAAKLGEPLPISYVRLDELKRWQAKTELSAIVRGGRSLVYPVVCGGKICRDIEVGLRGGTWKFVKCTSAVIFREADKLRADRITAHNSKASDFVLLAIANDHFLMYRVGTQLYLISLFATDINGIETGKEYRAQDLLLLYRDRN